MKIVEGCVKKKVEIEADWFELSLAQPNDTPYHCDSTKPSWKISKIELH